MVQGHPNQARTRWSWQTWRVAFLRHRRTLVRFGIVGLLNTGLDVLVFTLLVYRVGLAVVFANTCSYSIGLLQSFILNTFWTFGEDSRTSNHTILTRFSRFVLCNVMGLGLSNLLVWALTARISPIGAKMAAVAATFCWNYTTSRWWVFRTS